MTDIEKTYGIRETFNKKLSFLSEEMKKYLKNLSHDELVQLKEWIDDSTPIEDLLYFPDGDGAEHDKKTLANIAKLDHPVITESDNLYASKDDLKIGEYNIYRNKYYYSLSKDSDETVTITDATNPDGKKIEVDQQTFSKNFVHVTSEEVQDEDKKNKKFGRKSSGIVPMFTSDAPYGNVSVGTISGCMPNTAGT